MQHNPQQESYQTFVFLGQQEEVNVFPQPNTALQLPLLGSSEATIGTTTADHHSTVGTSEVLCVGNMLPWPATAYVEQFSPEQTPRSGLDTHGGDPDNFGAESLMPCLTSHGISVLRHPCTLSTIPQLMPAIPHLNHGPPHDPDANAAASGSCIPNIEPMPGNFNFQLNFDHEEERKDISKYNITTYSKKLNRLFVKQNKKIPVHFYLSTKIPQCSYIRVMALFKTPDVIRNIVTTCLNHQASVAGEHLEHFI